MCQDEGECRGEASGSDFEDCLGRAEELWAGPGTIRRLRRGGRGSIVGYQDLLGAMGCRWEQVDQGQHRNARR